MAPTRKSKQPAATLVTPPGFDPLRAALADVESEIVQLEASLRKKRSVRDALAQAIVIQSRAAAEAR